MSEAEEKKPARQRILDTASEMFYRDGVRAVGIDAIIARSGVAKMSLYRNFTSKDALVSAWLEERNAAFWRRWDVIMRVSGRACRTAQAVATYRTSSGRSARSGCRSFPP